MMGVLGWAWDAVANLKLHQLCDAYDARILHDWDRTSHQLAMLDGVVSTMVNIHTKKRIKPRSASAFHPFRENIRKGLILTGDAEGMKTLRMLGDAVLGKVY